MSIPAISPESIPKLPISCSLLALTIFVMEASGPGASPFERAEIVLNFVY